MPIPFLFITAAAASGIFGATKTVKAVSDNRIAGRINDLANQTIDEAKATLEHQRDAVSRSLEEMGELKVHILDGNVREFLDTFEQIKNVDFTDSLGLEELKNLKIEKKDFEELRELGNFAAEVAGGMTAGIAGGSLTAFGAYNAAVAFAHASTGTAIATLHGAAASNATLAFFGGGPIAYGGLGMKAGAIILNSMAIAPALMVMGLITSAKAQEKVNIALENRAEAKKVSEALKVAALQCNAIRRRTYMLYNLLSHLDAYFLPQIWKMEEIVKEEGFDYRAYSLDSKRAIATAASTACSIKAVLDTPILTAEGALTEESQLITEKISSIIYK